MTHYGLGEETSIVDQLEKQVLEITETADGECLVFLSCVWL